MNSVLHISTLMHSLASLCGSTPLAGVSFSFSAIAPLTGTILLHNFYVCFCLAGRNPMRAWCTTCTLLSLVVPATAFCLQTFVGIKESLVHYVPLMVIPGVIQANFFDWLVSGGWSWRRSFPPYAREWESPHSCKCSPLLLHHILVCLYLWVLVGTTTSVWELPPWPAQGI